MITKQKCLEVIGLAQHYQDEAEMRSSARLCVDDAINLYCKGEYDRAYWRALRSLQYSVGIFGDAYKLCQSYWPGEKPAWI